MLRLENIAWNSPDGKDILKGVDLTVDDGKMVVITGPNGGGKTTLARVIAGIEQPAAGKIILDGKDITNLDVTERAKEGISFAFQQPVRFKGITVRQLVETAAGTSCRRIRCVIFLAVWDSAQKTIWTVKSTRHCPAER